MNEKSKRKKQAQLIRIFRKMHRIAAILLFAFFLVVSVTTLLLGWKKHSGDVIMPQTRQGTSDRLEEWIPLTRLHQMAVDSIASYLPAETPFELDRMDVRKDKGIIKFSFKNNYREIQLDGATGAVLSVGTRRADLFEAIHDGSILDTWFDTEHGQFKLIYTSIMGCGLLLFTVSGFWLWYGPKRMKKKKPGPGRNRQLKGGLKQKFST